MEEVWEYLPYRRQQLVYIANNLPVGGGWSGWEVISTNRSHIKPYDSYSAAKGIITRNKRLNPYAPPGQVWEREYKIMKRKLIVHEWEDC